MEYQSFIYGFEDSDSDGRTETVISFAQKSYVLSIKL